MNYFSRINHFGEDVVAGIILFSDRALYGKSLHLSCFFSRIIVREYWHFYCASFVGEVNMLLMMNIVRKKPRRKSIMSHVRGTLGSDVKSMRKLPIRWKVCTFYITVVCSFQYF